MHATRKVRGDHQMSGAAGAAFAAGRYHPAWSVGTQLIVVVAATVAAVSLLAAKGAPPSEDCSSAIRDYDRGQIVRYLRWGGDPSVWGYRGSLLHYAIKNHDLAMVRMLLDRGVDVNQMCGIPGTTDHVWWTPLSYALAEGHADIAEELRVRGGREDGGWLNIP